jgi:hypothetical protein
MELPFKTKNCRFRSCMLYWICVKSLWQLYMYFYTAICRVPIVEWMSQSAHAARKVPVAVCPCCRVPKLCRVPVAECPSCKQRTCCRLPCCTQDAYFAQCPCCRVPKLHAEYMLQSAMMHAEFLLQSAHAAECPSCMQSTCCKVLCCTQSAY